MTVALTPKETAAIYLTAKKMLEGKSTKENLVIGGVKTEIIGGPNSFTITSIPKAAAVEVVYQILIQQETERREWESKQWRGG